MKNLRYFLVVFISSFLLSCASSPPEIDKSLNRTNIFYNTKIDYKTIDIAGVIEGIEFYKDKIALNKKGVYQSTYDYYQEIEYDNGTLLVLFWHKIDYVSAGFWDNINRIENWSPSIILFWRNIGEDYQSAIEKKYFLVNGKTEMAEMNYLKAERNDINNNPQGFKEIIKITEIVTFLGKSYIIETENYVVPFTSENLFSKEIATTSDEIINLFGLPDSREFYSVKWPDDKYMNGFYYNPDINHSLNGEHWRYKLYPDLVIDISSGRVKNFRANRNNVLYLKWKN